MDLDERSLQAEKQYPWNRIKIGQLTKKHRDNAQLQFETLLAGEPECKLYQVYLEQIETLRTADLPADWDGSYTYTSK